MSQQYQLTNVEAQRVMAVLDELTADLRLAFRLTPQSLASLSDISSVVVSNAVSFQKHDQVLMINGQGQENERFFAMQADLEKQFSVLAAQLEGPVSEFVADAEHDAQDAVVGEFFDVARRLRKNTRDICRYLRRSAHLDRKLQTLPQQPAPLAERFIKVLENLKSQTLRSLSTSVEEDKAEKEHFENVSVREKTLTEQERMLTKDLATVKRDREKAVKARDAQIAVLEAEKAELLQMTANAGKAVGEGSNAADKAVHEAEVEKLTKRLQKLTEELDRAKQDNREKEEAMKKRSYKKETDVEAWVQKYDQEMVALNEEYVSLSEQFSSEKARMRRLENHFEALRLVEGADAARNMMQMANELEVAAKAKRLGDAALLLQSCLRGHKGRAEFAKSKKKGAKGKGKGKKGGAKKKK